MNKLALLLTLFALTLPTLAIAQPEGSPHERPDRDRSAQRERPDRDRQSDRPGDRHGSDRKGAGKREPISADQLEQAIATLRAMHPETKLPWLERIEKLAEENPEEAAKRLSRYPRLRELMETREKRPAEFELNSQQSRLMREVFPLVRKIREAEKNEDQATVETLRPQLRKRIETLFEVRLKLKELEIERIRKQLQRAEQELSDIKADGTSLINDKMDELIERGGGPPGPRGEDGDRPERSKKPDRSDRE
ncbi:MAG: hypothetical protein AB8C95_13640 [Phycisphaeraceae bacterium]